MEKNRKKFSKWILLAIGIVSIVLYIIPAVIIGKTDGNFTDRQLMWYSLGLLQAVLLFAILYISDFICTFNKKTTVMKIVSSLFLTFLLCVGVVLYITDIQYNVCVRDRDIADAAAEKASEENSPDKEELRERYLSLRSKLKSIDFKHDICWLIFIVSSSVDRFVLSWRKEKIYPAADSAGDGEPGTGEN